MLVGSLLHGDSWGQFGAANSVAMARARRVFPPAHAPSALAPGDSWPFPPAHMMCISTREIGEQCVKLASVLCHSSVG